MLFIFLITIVFIAELIITVAVITTLIKLDKKLKRADTFLEKAAPNIKAVCELIRGISEQIAELTPEWVEKFRETRDKIILKQLESLMAGILFWSINIKVIKRIRKSKFIKTAWKGLSLLQNVI